MHAETSEEPDDKVKCICCGHEFSRDDSNVMKVFSRYACRDSEKCYEFSTTEQT